MGELFILNETGEPVEEPDFSKWKSWVTNNDCALQCTYIAGIYVSTVFLTANHAPNGEARILYETRVFGLESGKEDIQSYTTKHQALRGHRAFVQKYKQQLQ